MPGGERRVSRAVLQALGGAPQVIHSDNSSALTGEAQPRSGTDAYAELLEHYGLRVRALQPG